MKYPRVPWVAGLLALPVSFALILTIAAWSDPRVWIQFDWNGTRHDMDQLFRLYLILGVPFEFGASLILSALTWVVVKRPIRFWRPFVFCFSTLGFSGLAFHLWHSWRYVDKATSVMRGFSLVVGYPVAIPVMLLLGLPLLWSLLLMFFTITMRSETPQAIQREVKRNCDAIWRPPRN